METGHEDIPASDIADQTPSTSDQTPHEENAHTSVLPKSAEETSTFISQQISPVSSSMMQADDVYEFKSSPEDNTASILLNTDAVCSKATPSYTPNNEIRCGLDEEADLTEEGNLIVDEQMEVDELETKPVVPTFEIERCDDEEEEIDEEQSDQKGSDDRRKVPPLRIVFNKNSNGEESSKTLSPSISLNQADAQTSGTPVRKRQTRKLLNASEKRSASTRITRGQLAKQVVNPNEEDGKALGKRQRGTRRGVSASMSVSMTGVASRALTPQREREVSLAPSTSSVIQNDQAGTSMPPSPDANSRSSGGIASENDTAFNLQPERLSYSVINLFNQADTGAYMGLKKMLHQRWARDFQEQQNQEWISVQNKPSSLKKKKLFIPLPPQPKLDGSSLDLMENQLIRQKHLKRQHASERSKLSEFIEREFKRQLNDIPSRSRTAITCMRILADNDVYNGNIIDINNDDLSKSQLKPRDEVIEQVRVQVEPLVNNTLKRHSMEADCLYFEQCAEWERFVSDQISLENRNKIEDFTLRNCVKRIETRAVNLDRIIR